MVNGCTISPDVRWSDRKVQWQFKEDVEKPMRSESFGTDISTLVFLRTRKGFRIQLILLSWSKLCMAYTHVYILLELWTQDIDEQKMKSSYMLDLRERRNDALKLAKEELELSQASRTNTSTEKQRLGVLGLATRC